MIKKPVMKTNIVFAGALRKTDVVFTEHLRRIRLFVGTDFFPRGELIVAAS
jgi:hypothetical protein